MRLSNGCSPFEASLPVGEAQSRMGDSMRRVRENDDGIPTVFEELTYDANGPYRAEISVASLQDLRELKRNGKLISVRMRGVKPGVADQRSLINADEITDFDWIL